MFLFLMEMGSLSLGSVLFLFLSLVIATTSQLDFFYSECSGQGNYTNDSPFKKNLDIVLSTISSNSNTDTRVEDYGFYNATSGEQDPDRANAKVLCRKGVLLEQCKSCVNDSVSRIIQNCPNQKAATGWYSDCQILYSNNSVHGEISISSGPYTLYNVNQAPDAQGLNEERRELLDRLREEAASGSSIRKSASGDLKLTSPNKYTIYGLVDCFPDMSYFDCDVCLSRLQSSLPNGSIGARSVVTSCQIGYEIQPLYRPLKEPDPFRSECSNNGNYANDNPFKKNLDIVLSSISTNAKLDYGFYASHGEEPERANVMALCRGLVPLEQCRSCVNNSASEISLNCPNQKEGAGWYNDCQIRYSNNSIYGVEDHTDPMILHNSTIAQDAKGFNEALQRLLDRLRNETASGTPTRKSASGVEKVTSLSMDDNYNTIYGLLDCFPTLNPSDCDRCLTKLQNRIPSCCNTSIGARLMSSSCQMNYEIHPIYPSSDDLSPTQGFGRSNNTTRTRLKKNNTTRTIIIVVFIVLSVSILLLLLLLIFWRKRKRNRKLKSVFGQIAESTNEIISIEMLQFDFETIKLVTNEFSSENKIGQGGFGAVYKGKLPDGREIAVKRLAKDSQQGDVEFRNEVLLVAKLHHRNLVRLLGFCLQRNERLLIYEFVQNASLDHFIFDNLENQIHLDWKMRYKIINGIARGLLYLHEDSRLLIIHRDLKASNILLDEKMNPKIADFGTARMFEVDETHCNTNRIVGTYGYMAPEYALDGHFSVKSDVFSFGVLVLEIISGQKNICFRNGKKVEDLSSSAWKNWRAGTIKNVIDPKLMDDSIDEMSRFIHIGLLCVQENAVDRPTMASVILMLNTFSLSLPAPSEPAFFMHSHIEEFDTPREPPLTEIFITDELHPR